MCTCPPFETVTVPLPAGPTLRSSAKAAEPRPLTVTSPLPPGADDQLCSGLDEPAVSHRKVSLAPVADGQRAGIGLEQGAGVAVDDDVADAARFPARHDPARRGRAAAENAEVAGAALAEDEFAGAETGAVAGDREGTGAARLDRPRTDSDAGGDGADGALVGQRHRPGAGVADVQGLDVPDGGGPGGADGAAVVNHDRVG